MKNKTKLHLKKWFAAIALFALFAGTQTVMAQCSYVTIYEKDTVSYTITNDFPIYDSTGSAKINDSLYHLSLMKWVASDSTMMTPYLGVDSKSQAYIEITKKVYDAFSNARKAKINKFPTYYRIKED